MAVLEVKGLKKIYPTFTLNNVSFALEEGKITGFIGRNGAGKSTTLNSLFNFVHPDDGEVNFWGENINENETKIKQKVGFVSSGVNCYPNKKLKIITSVTKSFYPNWDENAYQKYMKSFGLDENKTPKQLSMGMKIKYAIVLALSHKAELLILDEPTSGLDPVSRGRTS
jgi:ABC-2 type transport system ATP-binding protein